MHSKFRYILIALYYSDADAYYAVVYLPIVAVVSFEEPHYSVPINDSSISVPVTLSGATSQDVIIQVNITDETALGRSVYKYSACYYA